MEDHAHGLLTLGISSVELLSTHLQPITAQHGNIAYQPIIAQCDIITTNEKPHLALHQRVDSLQMAGVGHHGQADVPDGDQS